MHLTQLLILPIMNMEITRKKRTVLLSSVLLCLVLSFNTNTLNAQDLKVIQQTPLSGTSGTSITIFGSNFDALPADNIVTFSPAAGGAGTTATVTAVHSAHLTTTVPEALTGGNYTISVQRTSDSAIKISPELFAVPTLGGNFGEPGSSDRLVYSLVVDSYMSIYAGDVDGDGDLDFISGSDNGFHWHENDGAADPAFQIHTVSASSNATTTVFAADLDGDGDLDLMSSSRIDNKLAWYENDGAADPTFTTHLVTNSNEWLLSVHAADVDGDGDLDLMSASFTDDKVAWYENDGNDDPSFTEHVVSNTDNGVRNVHAADLDGDGDLDLISLSYSQGNFLWHENDGAADPAFTKHTVYLETSGGRVVRAGDIDGDGDLDLMVAFEFQDTIAWYENNGNAIPSFTKHIISDSVYGASSVFASDLDADGDLDLMSSSFEDNKIAWYENNGNIVPVFTEHAVSTDAIGAGGIFAGDVDGDGDLDLISAASEGRKIFWYESTIFPIELTQLQPVQGVPGTEVMLSGAHFEAVAANNIVTFTPAKGGDGVTATVTAVDKARLTLNVPELSGGNYVVSVQKTSDASVDTIADLFTVITGGGYFDPDYLEVSYSEVGSFHVHAGDLDGDGDFDLVAASTIDDKIFWYENNGAVNPTFSEHIVSSAVDGALSVYAADVDGDGDLDMLSASFIDNKIAWYENDGANNPAFAGHIVSSTANGAISVYAADVDGDGDLDLMSASFSDNKIAWYENDGNDDPSFTEYVVSNTANGARSVYASDVDGDGDLDLMSASFNDNKIAWYENDGAVNPTFTEHVVNSTANGAVSVYAKDMDGDGDIDLLSASGHSISWYENDGTADPAFTEHIVNDATPWATGNIYAEDINGDGNADILTGWGSIEIDWVESSGSLTPHYTINTFQEGDIVYPVDVNGDGNLDLLFGSSSSVYVYKNLVPVSHAGHSLALDGDGDYMDISFMNDDRDQDLDFTLEAWVKPDINNQADPIGVLFGRNSEDGDNNLLLITINNTFGSSARRIQVQDASLNWVITGPELVSDRWYHVAYTRSGVTGTLFLDGNQVGQHLFNTILSNEDWLTIGQEFDPGLVSGNYLRGLVDEVRVWSVARTAQEIQENMYQAVAERNSLLMGYWNFKEGSGTTVPDITGRENTGLLMGNASFNTDTHPYGTIISGTEGWRIMASPLAEVSYGALLEDFWTQGFTGADSEGGVSNVYTWSEADQQFQSISNAADIPPVGKGFLVYVFDDQDFDDFVEGFPKTIRFDNAQNEGNIAPVLSFTNTGVPDSIGWNLVGNPYGSTIKWDNGGEDFSSINLDEAYYVWNAAAGEYQSHNGSAGTLANNLISPFQGFWVKTNTSSPSITFTDEARSGGGIFRKDAAIPQLKFVLSGASKTSATLLMLSENASVEKDRLDAYKLASLNADYLSLFTQTEAGAALDINALPLDLEEALEIALGFDGSELSGEFELSWNTEALPEGWKFVLRDNVTGQRFDVREQSAFSFELAKAKTSKVSETLEVLGEDKLVAPSHGMITPKVMSASSPKGQAEKAKDSSPRFTLTITSKQAVTNEPFSELPEAVALQQNYPNPFNPSTVISYQLPVNSRVQLQVFDMLGRQVAELINGNVEAGFHQVTFDARNLASGMYIYRLQAGNAVFTKKLTLIK
ncbi:MAG: FG-GAP-like repeat-containing protein [Balneolaceae bacterium]